MKQHKVTTRNSIGRFRPLNDQRSDDSTLKHMEGETGSNRTHFPDLIQIKLIYVHSYVAHLNNFEGIICEFESRTGIFFYLLF